jgi:hypothetical protein
MRGMLDRSRVVGCGRGRRESTGEGEQVGVLGKSGIMNSQTQGSHVLERFSITLLEFRQVALETNPRIP